MLKIYSSLIISMICKWIWICTAVSHRYALRIGAGECSCLCARRVYMRTVNSEWECKRICKHTQNMKYEFEQINLTRNSICFLMKWKPNDRQDTKLYRRKYQVFIFHQRWIHSAWTAVDWRNRDTEKPNERARWREKGEWTYHLCHKAANEVVITSINGSNKI